MTLRNIRILIVLSLILTIVTAREANKLCFAQKDAPRRGLINDGIFIPPELLVTNIVMGEEPFAIVNGEIVNEGDKVEGVKVYKIDKDFVEFSSGTHYFMKMIESSYGRKKGSDD